MNKNILKMASNEYIYQNDPITPTTPSSSDCVNNSTINPDECNLQEPIKYVLQTPKKKIFTRKCFLKYFFYFILILPAIAYTIYTSTFFLNEALNVKICSKGSNFYNYLFTCVIFAYLFSIGNIFWIFIYNYHKYALFKDLPCVSKIYFSIYFLISLFYILTYFFNYYLIENSWNIYKKINIFVEYFFQTYLFIYIILLVRYLFNSEY